MDKVGSALTHHKAKILLSLLPVWTLAVWHHPNSWLDTLLTVGSLWSVIPLHLVTHKSWGWHTNAVWGPQHSGFTRVPTATALSKYSCSSFKCHCALCYCLETSVAAEQLESELLEMWEMFLASLCKGFFQSRLPAWATISCLRRVFDRPEWLLVGMHAG